MLRGSITAGRRQCVINQKNRAIFKFYAYVAVLESFFAFVVGATILSCMWKVKNALFEFDTLARIAYLYDLEACDVVQLQEQQFNELVLSNNTRGFNVVPIMRLHATVPHITRSSAAMRRHTEVSISLHIIWSCLSFLTLYIVRGNISALGWKRVMLTIFYYSYVSMCFFDSFMAIHYIAHIRQSLTMGMVIRYSGWKDINVQNYDNFAGWLPIAGCAFWLRGIVIFALNLYGCSCINSAIHSITATEVSQKVEFYGNVPIPEAMQEYTSSEPVLHVTRNTAMP